MHPRPRILFSRCLGFDRCRYDGSMVDDRFAARLAAMCDVTTACPEMESGLGVPRDPVRLVMRNGRVAMVQPATGRDHTGTMTAWCAAAAARFSVGPDSVDGALLKSRSPSCGIKDVKIYRTEAAGAAFDHGAGLFGSALSQALAGAPVEDEGRLRNHVIRDHFLSALYSWARFRAAVGEGRPGAIVDYHSRHKLLFLAVNQASMRRLGRIVAGIGKQALNQTVSAYKEELGRMFSAPARTGGIMNTAMHAFGGFSERLSAAERKFFVDSMEEYRDERIPASAILSLLKGWAVRFEVDYLLGQVFLEPYPRELVDIADSGKGRDY